MLRLMGLLALGAYERLVPVRKSVCCAYRATSGRSPCFEFAKRAISRYGFLKGMGLIHLRTTECSEAAHALANSERRWRDSLLARPSVMSQFMDEAEDWDRGDTLPMQWDAQGNFVPRPVQAPAYKTSKISDPRHAQDLQSVQGRIKVQARGCGPFVWPRQYSASEPTPRHTAGLQPSL